MKMKNENLLMVAAGLIIGVIAGGLVIFGNPVNMGFCIACFIRDTAGALKLHNAVPVEYVRPEIIGLVLGSFLLAVTRKEFAPRGGSSVMTSFVLGFFVMIGCLMFLGCPFRTILRLAGGDGNAILGLAGFILGILAGVFFLQKGYSLKRTYQQSKGEGAVAPLTAAALLGVTVFAPYLLNVTPAGKGPGAMHAAIAISLAAGIVVGALAQRTRLCMVGGVRDLVLFGQWKLMLGFLAILAAALTVNMIVGNFHPGFAGQPIAHTDGLWNLLGMLLAGFGCVLLGGCPLRQLILTGEGNTDSAVTVLGLAVGAAFAHNFGLAASAKGPTGHGKYAVIIGLIVVGVIACYHTCNSKKA